MRDAAPAVVVVFRGGGGFEEGDPPAAWSVFGLAGSIPSVNAAPEPGSTRLRECPEHLPPGAGRHTPTGRMTGRYWEHWEHWEHWEY